MNLKNLAIGSLLATSLIFVGCGDDDTAPTPDAGGSDVPVVATDTGPGETDAGPSEPLPGCDGECFFVVDELNIPAPDGADGTSIGANLDDEITTMDDNLGGCGKLDFVHPDGTLGIDNALAQILPIIEGMLDEPIADQLGAQIADGSLLITVSLQGVDGANDSSVMGVLYPDGAIPGGAAPMLNGETLAPGQTIDIDSAPINIPGAIVNGRFIASLPNFPIDIPLPDGALVINVSQAIFSADVTPNGLENGEIAGSLSIDELAVAIGAAGIDAIDEATARVILGGVGDLEPDETGTVCARLSLGIGFNAIPAVQGATL